MVAGINTEESRGNRFRRSALLKSKACFQNKFKTKIADNFSEWIGSFRLLYKEYLSAGYVNKQTPSRILFKINHLLPETVVFVTNIFQTPVSTLTQFFDDPQFGLPSDSVYRPELDSLRSDGRVISELGSLAIQKNFRWQNLFLQKYRAMYWYSRKRKINDLCIAVNPKHVAYYKTVFLFETFGALKFYPRVQAPAVLMRLNLDRFPERLMETYHHMEDECNLYDFFHYLEGNPIKDYEIALRRMGVINGNGCPRIDSATVKYMLNSNPEALKDLSADHTSYLRRLYPGIFH